MIVFEGECSEEIKKFAVNIGKKIMNFVGIFPSIPFTALTIYLGICVDYIYVVLSIVVVCSNNVALFYCSKRKRKGYYNANQG